MIFHLKLRLIRRNFTSNPGRFIIFYLADLLFLLLVLPCEHSFSQEPVRVIPNGTEGEVMVVKDSETKDAKIKNWNEFDGPLTTKKKNVW